MNCKRSCKRDGVRRKTAEQFVDTLKKLSKLTIEKEAELVEINPLSNYAR